MWLPLSVSTVRKLRLLKTCMKNFSKFVLWRLQRRWAPESCPSPGHLLTWSDPCVTSSERNFCRYEGLQGDHGKRKSNPRLVGYREEKYVRQIRSNTTKLSGFVTICFQWQMYEWLLLYVPLRYLCILKHVLPETEDAWQDMLLYLRRHRSRYFNGKRKINY